MTSALGATTDAQQLPPQVRPQEEGSSTFYRAIPYAVATLGAAIAGIVIACTFPYSALALIAGVALAILGAYAFYGVVACGILHSNNPSAFSENVGKSMVTGAATGVAEMVTMTAQVLFLSWITGRR